MNEQLPISMVQLELELTLPQRAQRIRDLVGTARLCIIEIGRELIAAKKLVVHGEWLPWIDREFGWDDVTASRYMKVARAFQNLQREEFAGLTIDATALYALSAPDVPQEARDEAIERAAGGEQISKADADKMVADAKAAEAATREVQVREAIDAYDAQHRRQVAEAITEATQRLRKDKKALQDEIARIKANAETPDLTALSETVRKMLGLKKLGEEQWRLIAQILGKAISVGGKSYDPISKEQLLRNEENLRITSGVTHALETLSGAPSADVMKAAAWPVQRKQHLRVLNGVIKWCTEYRAALGKG